MPLRFLHTSDIHLLDLRGVMPWRYLGKRLTGRLNLAIRRGHQHDGQLFDEMMTMISDLEVDRLVVTGDLTNLSLESEFRHCAGKLGALPIPCTVIPGNHDVYTRDSQRDGLFERYLTGHMQGQRCGDAAYPFVQRHDDVALIGVSTAVATAPFHATGWIGAAQLERLCTILAQTRAEGLFRVILIHHPPTPGVSKRRHDLLDLAAFGEVLAEHGAELILHGHEHVRLDTRLAGPDGPIEVHGIGSGTSLSRRPGRQASFSIYDVSAKGLVRDLYVCNGNAFQLQRESTSPQPVDQPA